LSNESPLESITTEWLLLSLPLPADRAFPRHVGLKADLQGQFMQWTG